jgi:hypothetical protein
MKLLRFAGLYLTHLLTALFITAIVTTAIERAYRPRTALGTVQREWILSIACAAAIGLLMFRTWKWRPAMWVWVLPTLWFGLNILLLMNRFGGAWYYLSGVACAEGFARPSSCIEWLLATIPFIRTIAYSLGTLAGAYLFAGRPALLGTAAHREESS